MIRIAIGGISHESNSFSPVPTSLESFPYPPPPGDRIISSYRNTRTIIGGFLDAAEKLSLEPVPIFWTAARPSRPVDQVAYDTLKTEFLDCLRSTTNIDGVILTLHGAMVTEEIEDAEGNLIRAVREVVGSLPIVTTLDLHANITAEMAEDADIIIGYDTYPHIDHHERGFEAAQLVLATIEGQIHPTTAYRQLPLLTSAPAQCTMKPPMSEVIKKLHALEGRSGVVTATLSMGFAFADIHDAGASVLVTTNGDQALAEQHAEEFARYVWEMRDAFDINLVSVEEGIEYANSTEGKPIVLADGADNPGGGGPCDGTTILRAFIEADVQDAVIAVIADRESVASAIETGVGNQVELNVGGKTDRLHGDPVPVTAYVKTISDGQYVSKGPMGRGWHSTKVDPRLSGGIGGMGRTAVVKVGGVEIILTEQRVQPIDAEVLRSVGIEPTDRKLIALKSAVHFRADYTPIAHEILDTDTPGVHNPNLFTYAYQNVRRPIYPLDSNATF